MTITIHNRSEIPAQGTSTRGNRKSIYCITTGEVYASQTDAARILGVNHSAISWVVTGRMKTCKGLRFCYCSAITEHFDEIAEAARITSQKANEYDRIIASREKEEKARETFAAHQRNCERLRARLERETRLMNEAQAVIDSFEN